MNECIIKNVMVVHISNQVLLDCVDCELIEAFFGLTGSGGGF